MPNELVTPSGTYYQIKQYRRREDRREKWLHHKDRRLHVTQPKYTRNRLLKLLGYYFAFYVFLAVFVTLYFWLIFTLQVPEDQPLISKGTSLSSVPGNFVQAGKLIRFKQNHTHETNPYIDQIENFVAKYSHESIRHLRGCNLDNFWGYRSGLPCVLLKLNYALNFKAVTYSNAITLPDEVPNSLYDHILQLSVEQRKSRIWMTCVFADSQIEASVEYVPDRYYDTDGLFTEKNLFLKSLSENFTDEEVLDDPAFRRVIGVKFQNLPINRDVYVKCTAWAKNIPLEFASIMFILHIEGVVVPPKVDSNSD